MKTFLYIFVTLFLTSSTAFSDAPSVHGMLLFGEKLTYASHLPMFHAPHDYQVILKLKLNELTNSKALLSYKKAKVGGQKYFTLLPEVMDLSQVIDGIVTSFTANVFEGHFERGGKDLGRVSVEIESIVYSSKLDADKVAEKYQEYLVFGENGEYYGAHLIKERPSFDTILAVTQPKKTRELKCRTRLCEPASMSWPIADSSLPIILKHLKLSQTSENNLPKEGSFLGWLFGANAKVISILYLEENELSF